MMQCLDGCCNFMMQASNTKDRLDAMVTAEGLRAVSPAWLWAT